MIKKYLSSLSLTSVLGLVLTTFLVLQIVSRDTFRINDEAVNLTMAKNMSIDESYIMKPSYEPHQFKKDWKNYSLPLILMPPVYPYLIFKLSKIFDIKIFSSASIFQAFLFIIFIFCIKHQSDHKDFLFRVLLLLLSPKLLEYLTNFEHEGMLCASGFGAVIFSRKKELKWSALVGVLLGIGFLSKTWLVGPFVLGCAASLVSRYLLMEVDLKTLLIKISLTSFSFITIAFSHLIFIYLNDPENLTLWVDQVYFGVLKPGVNSKLFTNKSQGWANQWWYYPGVFLRENFLITAFCLINISSRKDIYKIFSNEKVCYTVTLLSFIPLSFVNIKEQAYILPCLLSPLFLLSPEQIKLNKILLIKIFLITIYIGVINHPTLSNIVKDSRLSLNYGFIFILLFLAWSYKKRSALLMVLTSFSILFSIKAEKDSHQKLSEIKEVSKILQSDKEFNSNNQVCASEYGILGFYTGRKVIKFDWLQRFTPWVTKKAIFIVAPSSYSFDPESDAFKAIIKNYYPLKKFKYHTVFKKKF